MLPAARMIGASEIVFPDVLYSAEATVDRVKSLHDDVDKEFGYAAVAQGRTFHDVVWSIEQYYDIPYVSTIMLPRLVNEIDKRARYIILEGIANRPDLIERFQWHALGASGWINEVAYLSHFPFLRGMDTSLPVVMGMAGEPLLTGTYVSRPDNFFEAELTDDQRGLVYANCQQYLHWAGASTPSSPVREVQSQ